MDKFFLMAFNFSLLIGITVISTSCATHSTRCANLVGEGLYCLQSSAVLTPLEEQQKISVDFDATHETMIAELVVNKSGMRLVGLTPLGYKVVEVSYNNEEIHTVQSPSKQLDPVLLMAMIQLAIWPVDSIREGLETTLLLEETENHRRYLAGEILVLDVHFLNDKKKRLSFPTVNLEIEIETLPEMESL